MVRNKRAWWARPLLTVLLALALTVAPAWAGESADGEVARMLHAAARLYGLDPELLIAIAHVESGGNPRAVSVKGARGLMQLMPGTAEQFGVENPFDPIDNTLGAARFLNYLREWQARRTDLALNLPELIAAYNAGPHAIEKYHGIPPYAETRQYVRKVLLTYLLSGPGQLPATIVRPRREAPQRVLLDSGPDALDQLSEIRRNRALALSRQQQMPSR